MESSMKVFPMFFTKVKYQYFTKVKYQNINNVIVKQLHKTGGK